MPTIAKVDDYHNVLASLLIAFEADAYLGSATRGQIHHLGNPKLGIERAQSRDYPKHMYRWVSIF
jgi:hypothetical protein